MQRIILYNVSLHHVHRELSYSFHLLCELTRRYNHIRLCKCVYLTVMITRIELIEFSIQYYNNIQIMQKFELQKVTVNTIHSF